MDENLKCGKRPTRLLALYGLLNFISQAVKMVMQPMVQLSLFKIGSRVTDKGGLSRILAKFLD